MHTIEWIPPTWNSGEVSSDEGCAPLGGNRLRPDSAALTRFANRIPVTCAIVPRWVVMQPFERPVVPDVYRITNGSSSSIAVVGGVSCGTSSSAIGTVPAGACSPM